MRWDPWRFPEICFEGIPLLQDLNEFDQELFVREEKLGPFLDRDGCSLDGITNIIIGRCLG